jgi:hypothetical protein
MIVLLGLLRSRDLCPVSGRICGLSREEDSAGRRRSSADRGQRSQAGVVEPTRLRPRDPGAINRADGHAGARDGALSATAGFLLRQAYVTVSRLHS